MAKGRKKKKHICAECGESFNHGIGLRKHQRQTGHKGSEIVEEGDEPPASAPAAAPAATPAPAPAPEPAVAPAPEPEPTPEPEAEPVFQEEDDQTVAVPRPSGPISDLTSTVAAPPPHSPAPPFVAPPAASKIHETRTKLNLVGRGMKVVLSAKAKDAGQQFKRSARSGADIFTEALKLAVALICFLAVPTVVFFWWKAQNPTPHVNPDRPEMFSFEDGARAARSSLLRYLDYVGRAEWEEAYLLLSPEWRQDLPLASFKDAFLDIEDLRWAVNDQRLVSDGEAEVLVRLAFQEGGRPRRFVGRFLLLRGPQGWRIDRAELSSDPTS